MEFQYYEFQSLDRPLTAAEMKTIGAWSSRTTPTNRRAVFTYSYGSFGQNMLQATAKYFDAALYQANWGNRQLIFRFPKKLVDVQALQQYALDSYVEITVRGEFVLLDFQNGEEPEGDGDWIEEEDSSLTELLPLRDAILRGDYRSLFMAWLEGATRIAEYDEDDEAIETMPPIPAGLKTLSPDLEAFMDFMQIDADLIGGAAFHSAEMQQAAPMDLEATIQKMPETERLGFLHRLAQDEPQLAWAFQKRLQELSPTPNLSLASTADITLTDILTLRDKAESERIAREEKARHKAHEQKMKTIQKEESALWKSAMENVDTRLGSGYEKATATLKDLYDMALYFTKKDQFELRFEPFMERARGSQALWNRLEKVGLVKGKR